MDARDFSLFDCLGRLVIDYRANDDLVASGFDMFDPADFDSSDALGYPTIRAWVDGFAGSGYRTATAFIQWIDTIRIDSAGNRTEDRELDLTAEFAHRGIPFFAWGYPASLYDAPAHNMNGASWMRWRATTWFVTIPARWTAFQVRPLVGFQWGYEEGTTGLGLLPLVDATDSLWEADRQWLAEQCPAFRFD